MSYNVPLYETASMAFPRRSLKEMLAEYEQRQQRKLQQQEEPDDELAWLKKVMDDETI